MAPSRRKGVNKAAATTAACRQWKFGDLVLVKVKGFPTWLATITFCNPADIEAFTEEKKQSLLVRRQGKGVDFFLAVQEIIDSYEKLKENQDDITNSNEVSGVNVTIPVDSSAKLSSNLGLKDKT
ncbi:hypothetical protein K1719_022680 [Acacia pycnantha]|nr:hypothetical protein K1719_022680 [Acacia pycnantha]